MHDSADFDPSGGRYADPVIGCIKDGIWAAGGVSQQDITVCMDAELSGGGAGGEVNGVIDGDIDIALRGFGENRDIAGLTGSLQQGFLHRQQSAVVEQGDTGSGVSDPRTHAAAELELQFSWALADIEGTGGGEVVDGQPGGVEHEAGIEDAAIFEASEADGAGGGLRSGVSGCGPSATLALQQLQHSTKERA